MKNNHQKKVIDYYSHPESRFGYTFLTWDTKHFGFYPHKKRDISEKEAQVKMTEELVKRLQVRKDDLVLDAGCGRGTVACYLARTYGSQIMGIDIVPFELEMAKKRAVREGIKNRVKFYRRDYSQTGFPHNHFDKIFTLETLVHSPDFRVTLQEFFRVLKPGGMLVLFEYSRSESSEFTRREKMMFDLINEKSSMTSLDTMYHRVVGKCLRDIGFTHIKGEDITPYMLPSLERFYRHAKIPYVFLQLFRLHKYFINTTAGVEFYRMMQRRLVRYRIFSARKPCT